MKIKNPGLKIALTATVLIGGLTASAAQAEIITYDLVWEPFGPMYEGSATGQVTIDTDLLPNPGFYAGEWAGSAFSNFSITIVNAFIGNGTFSTANGDFAEVLWNVGNNDAGPGLGSGGDGGPVNPIDLHTELIGQAGFLDFNVFSSAFAGKPRTGPGGDPAAPTGVERFVLLTGGYNFEAGGGPGMPDGDLIQLVSMNPVPAPSSLALLALTAMPSTRRRR